MKDKMLVSAAALSVIKQYTSKPIGYNCPLCHEEVMLVTNKKRSDIRGFIVTVDRGRE